MKKNNELEKYYIDKEYFMTYDNEGNLIPIVNIKGHAPYEPDFVKTFSKSILNKTRENGNE